MPEMSETNTHEALRARAALANFKLGEVRTRTVNLYCRKLAAVAQEGGA